MVVQYLSVVQFRLGASARLLLELAIAAAIPLLDVSPRVAIAAMVIEAI